MGKRGYSESRKWMVVVAAIWIQAFTGTNLDLSSYSSHLKAVLGISQVQLNSLSVASDLGKAFGWCSGLFLLYFPLHSLLFASAAASFFGYGFQWLLILRIISLPYVMVFLLSLLAGCSVCWFNTVCFVLCIRSFNANRSLALALALSFNGLSAALYNLIANAIDPNDDTLYLLLNSLIPLLISGITFVPVARQPQLQSLHVSVIRRDSLIFFSLYMLAALTGLYLLFLNFVSSSAQKAWILLVGAVFLLTLPLCLPGFAYARDWARRKTHSLSSVEGPSFNLEDSEHLELHEGLIERDGTHDDTTTMSYEMVDKEGRFGTEVEADISPALGEEHSARVLLCSWDFWLYFLTYFCGGTIGLVYSNNLGQISQSLGYASKTTSLVTIYSSWSFFGRLLSAVPDFLRDKFYFARTGWLAVAIVPAPIAIFLLAASGSESETVLRVSTALIGLSSGFVFSAAVSITSELFGPNNAGINHNILITNIPLGSLVYGLLAALVYDSNQGGSKNTSVLEEATLCLGRECFWQTFMWWGYISVLGLISSLLLFQRTRSAYDRIAKDQNQTEFSL